jgi:predicted transcriptional regulator
MKNDKYFTFPLSVLRGLEKDTDALSCLDLAINCGAYNAGRGYRNNHDEDKFEEQLERACDHYGFPLEEVEEGCEALKFYVTGAKVCGLTHKGALDGFSRSANESEKLIVNHTPRKNPFIKMSAKSLWAAVYQARHENNPTQERPKHGLSWREFRILAAILSWPTTREGFTSIGWESIQFRSCGFVNREEFKAAERIPSHLLKLSRRQIRSTLDTLEELNFFARFRQSTGPRGGRYYYSFRHSRDELAKAVCDKVNFQDRLRVAQHREEDARKCLELLKRAKSGTSL